MRTTLPTLLTISDDAFCCSMVVRRCIAVAKVEEHYRVWNPAGISTCWFQMFFIYIWFPLISMIQQHFQYHQYPPSCVLRNTRNFMEFPYISMMFQEKIGKSWSPSALPVTFPSVERDGIGLRHTRVIIWMVWPQGRQGDLEKRCFHHLMVNISWWYVAKAFIDYRWFMMMIVYNPSPNGRLW